MERCIGNLKQYIQHNLIEKQFDPKMILVHTTVALSYLHGQNIVHGNLRPENVLVQQITADVVVFKLSDYGSEERANSIRGTWYEAPEFYDKSEQLSCTTESDVWSLGMLAIYVGSKGQLPSGGRDVLDQDTFIKKCKSIVQAKLQFHDWKTAKKLVKELLRLKPEDRIKSYLIIHHPYFSLTNESSILFLAKKMYDLYPLYGNSCYDDKYNKLFRSLDDSIKSSECGQILKTFFEPIGWALFCDEKPSDYRPDFGNFVKAIRLSASAFAGYWWHFLKVYDMKTGIIENDCFFRLRPASQTPRILFQVRNAIKRPVTEIEI
jgi:serine/threonine protein kinase